MDADIRRYLKREYYKGKSLPARLIDAVFLKLLAFVVIFLFFWVLRTGFWRSLILAATLVSSFGMLKFVYHRARYHSFSARRIERAGDECALERMLLLDDAHREKLVRRLFAAALSEQTDAFRRAKKGYLCEKTYCRYFDCHPRSVVDVEAMTEAVREMRALHIKKCVFMTAAHFHEDARAMAARRSDSCILLENESLLKSLRNTAIYPNRREIFAYLSAEIAEKRITREKLRHAFFGADRGRSFALCAAVLLIMPMFTGQNILYSVAAAVCAVLAIYGFAKGGKSN